MITEHALSILRCPVCTGGLSPKCDYLVCAGCGSRFPVVDDIIVFLTRGDLSSFMGETWGGELLKENTGFFPDFTYPTNQDDIDGLRALSAEAEAQARGPGTGTYDEPGMTNEANRAVERSRDEIVRLCGADSAKTILDWPTGPGFCIEYLAHHVAPGAILVGLDIDFRRLTKTRARILKGSPPCRPLYVTADARRMPVKDGVLQAVTAWGGTTEIASARLGLRETYRVLEPNGRFGISGDQYKDNSPSVEVAEANGLAGLETRSRLESALAEIGFKDLEYEVLFEGYDIDLDTPDEERCPLPARGDWYSIVAAGVGK